MNASHVDFYLGASGDGIIKNLRYHGENPGVLEIKCPFSLDKIQVTQKTIAEIATEHKSFFLEYDGDERLEVEKDQRILLPSTRGNGY